MMDLNDPELEFMCDTTEVSAIEWKTLDDCSKNIRPYNLERLDIIKKFKQSIQRIEFLIEETQDVAKKYGAVCTPDFFGYNRNLELQYRGRIRELKDLKPIRKGDSDLKIAMKLVAET